MTRNLPRFVVLVEFSGNALEQLVHDSAATKAMRAPLTSCGQFDFHERLPGGKHYLVVSLRRLRRLTPPARVLQLVHRPEPTWHLLESTRSLTETWQTV